jgi:hypothetical protein
MELTKLGMSSVGMCLNFFHCIYLYDVAYKLRDKIGKALKTRAEAIRRALETYNNAATQLDPPREQLTWAKLMDTTTLADFDLLRESRQDIRQQLWTQPARREAMNLYFGIKRAKEEIVRLDVEIRRLITFMIDDHRTFYRAISFNIAINPMLANVLSHQWQFHNSIHTQIAARLHQTSKLKGFTGTLLPGVREGHDSFSDAGGLPPWAADVLGLVETYEDLEELPREVVTDSDLVLQLLENLSLQDDIDIQNSFE